MAVLAERIPLVMDVLTSEPRSSEEITHLVRAHPELQDDFCLYWDVTDILCDLAEAGKIGKCEIPPPPMYPGIKSGPGRTYDRYFSL